MRKLNLLMIIVLVAFFASCTDDDDSSPDGDGHHDEAHLMVVRITDSSGTITDFEFDAEHNHDGGDDDHDHEEHEMNLLSNETYSASLLFYNEDGDDITDEVEIAEHLVCFDIESGLNLSIERTDEDENSLEVGLISQWQTGDASEGHLVIEVKHQIDKAEIGEVDCNLGGTDVEAEFHVHIND